VICDVTTIISGNHNFNMAYFTQRYAPAVSYTSHDMTYCHPDYTQCCWVIQWILLYIHSRCIKIPHNTLYHTDMDIVRYMMHPHHVYEKCDRLNHKMWSCKFGNGSDHIVVRKALDAFHTTMVKHKINTKIYSMEIILKANKNI